MTVAFAGVEVPLDALRLLLISQAGLTLGFVGIIAAAYFAVWTATKPRRGLLPLHVVAISLAHSMLVGYATVDIYDRLGSPGGWQTPFLLVALVLSDVSMATMLRFERARIRHIREDHPRRRVDDL